jgi:hypothetical protein
MAVTQTLTVSGTAGLTFTNDPSATDYVIPEGGLSFPDFDMRIAYHPDQDDVPGSVLRSFALGLGSMPVQIDTCGTSLADLQANRRALEACFSQQDETLTITIGTESETYPFFPTWPKWGVIDSGRLIGRIFTATLSVPVNPLTDSGSSSSSGSA